MDPFGLFFERAVQLAAEWKIANSCGALAAARTFMTCRKEVEIGANLMMLKSGMLSNIGLHVQEIMHAQVVGEAMSYTHGLIGVIASIHFCGTQQARRLVVNWGGGGGGGSLLIKPGTIFIHNTT